MELEVDRVQGLVVGGSAMMSRKRESNKFAASSTAMRKCSTDGSGIGGDGSGSVV
jgi:hypothetical protein